MDIAKRGYCVGQAQRSLDLGGSPSAGEVLARIRKESRDESEKGRWFEQLFMRIARQEPEFEVSEIHRWPDWPEREELTGLDGRDMGVDLVARLESGEWVAIQCKCYDSRRVLGKKGVDAFLGGSQHKLFDLRWVVATCRWGPIAERAIKHANPPVRRIDFREYLNVPVLEEDAERPVRKPWPLQAEAISGVVSGLADHDRGRLVMACGTGKTFTSLRAAERIVEDGGRVLFAAPSIALVSQARREWLRQTTRKLDCLVVCSDSTAGGRGQTEDIGVSELECSVTTDPGKIAGLLRGDGDDMRVIFSTYHSLSRVTEAQAACGAPPFDLAIADEAHRTTGAISTRRKADKARKVDFQEFHDGARLKAEKRLYMTATPRFYTERSKRRRDEEGIKVVDMGHRDVYGPELYRLPFAKAVENGMLSDYRVIVLGVGEGSVTPGLKNRLQSLDVAPKGRRMPSAAEITRVLGVSLAVNGVTEGDELDKPGRLPRTMAFANSVARSKWYAEALEDPQVLAATTRRIVDGRAMKVVATHLDASSSALERNRELRELAQARKEGECRIVCNVKLFTEGVDVPSLDAVAFLDPRQSQIDVIQAVGRVMRKAEGKRFGYIVVPVVVQPGKDVAAALARGEDGYAAVGRVLRALQAHDNRLVGSVTDFVKVYESSGRIPPENGPEPPLELDLEEAGQGIYAHVARAIGLDRRGLLVADEIAHVVRRAGKMLKEEKAEEPLAQALDLLPEEAGGAKGVCVIAALMLCNACLLQRRLRDAAGIEEAARLERATSARHPAEVLKKDWRTILERDYAPVFRPALAILEALEESEEVDDAVRMIAECANRVAESLSDLGYDHAGPLYHRILGSAKSDGAFYTNNLSAIMLARLAFNRDFVDWSDAEAVAELRVIDPACGTGTLLMAALRTIKDRVAESRVLGDEDVASLHKRLVEDVLCGLDINRHAVQLAACNMTLGAPTVDYARMNLAAMPHGPREEGPPKAGALEILTAAEGARDLGALTSPERSLDGLDATQVAESTEIRFPLKDLDAVIMNPPFTANKNRNRKFDPVVVREMQEHEIGIRNRLLMKDPEAGKVVNANSIRTFFTPLADQLLCGDRGVLAMVFPTTACTGESGRRERRLLARRFHVETVVTSHDPDRPNFSENTGIHESLLICRRRNSIWGGGGDSICLVA